MLITIAKDAPSSTRAAILAAALERGLHAQAMKNGGGGEVIGIAGTLPVEQIELSGVERTLPVHKPFMMASLDARERSVVMVGNVAVGGDSPVFMAGPCSIESIDEQVEIARAVKSAGANILRGGAFKPRSSPYSFQGLGQEGLEALVAAREATGLPVVTEVMEPEQVELVARHADMLQIGSRNMANFPLLKRVGRTNTPVLLKRGFAATQEEFLMSAEYVMAGGNTNVVLCERGIRTFDAAFRFSLDLNVVPSIREVSHLPIIVDPSHGTGRRSLVARMAMAGLAAGADGLMIEVHADPDNALSDGYQTITPRELRRIQRRGLALLEALNGFDEADDLLDDVIAVTQLGAAARDAGAELERIA
ncbi:MAG: 3-deoxy-7-phosphoheptulonate synthase [Chloroflexota bacterium]|nr:3-deoxy-7-phosphoheptulonate synthase [Chloroflexota bacterium]